MASKTVNETSPPASPALLSTLNTSWPNSNAAVSSGRAANNSFSNLCVLNQSMLYVNVKELNLKVYSEIVVSWNIVDDETSEADFIGVYRLSKSLFLCLFVCF